MFLLSAAFGLFVSAQRLEVTPLPPAWLFTLDQVAGVLGCGALWLRRRWPVELAVVLVLLSAFSETIAGAMLAALFTVAVHRSPRTSGAVFGLSLVAALVYTAVRPEPGTPPLLMFMLGLALQGAALGWGLFVHHRRRLVVAQRDRAARAETEARLRAEQAQHLAREAIAREIHDVLGHRLSLLSVHAGALEFNPGADPADIARAARVIRESAHQALQDLREVVGVLRAPTGESPQPTLGDVGRLVAESARAGMPVDLIDDLGGGAPAGQVSRTAYRLVQEALTNALKHAPGAKVHVRLEGAPGRGLTVEVVNDAPSAGPTEHDLAGTGDRDLAGRPERDPAGAGGGQGLAGLAERVALAEGRLEHGPVASGGWRVRAWLPWPS